MNNQIRTRIPLASIAALIAACGAAQAQTFEPPTYNGSAAGTITTGQDGWYLPDSGGLDHNIFTYTGNTYGLPANPAGSTQLDIGVGGSNVARAQHAFNFTTSMVWTVTYDFCGKYNATPPAVDNLSSWSLQVVPTAAASTRQFQTLASWGTTIPPDHTTTADKFNLGLGYRPDNVVAGLIFGLPSSDWSNLLVNNWYRISVKWTNGDGTTNIPPRILTASIQDLTGGGPVLTTYVSNNNWYLTGGPGSTIPIGTEYRLFAGGSNSVAAYDNVTFTASSEGTGACCLAAGGCQVLSQTACANGGGTYKGDGVTCANAGCPLSGACCQDTGTCSIMTSTACAAAAGEYAGNNTTCPPTGTCPATGACCLENGTCVLAYTLHCTAMGGLYRGNGVVCGGSAAACAPFGFTGDDINSLDVGDTLASATQVTGYGQPLAYIHGYIGLGDRADVYRINVCNRSTFTASTVGNGNALDTELALFDSTGKGITFDDDTGNGTTQVNSQSIITGLYVPSNGIYYLAVAEFNNTTGIAAPSLPLDNVGATIWVEPSPWNGTTNPVGGTGFPEWQPNGTSTTKILNNTGSGPAWSVDPDTFGNYTVALTGACFLGCYANCDGSTVTPVLNANDFQCFLNAFAGALPPPPANFTGYANCDASTTAPILNANDFQCFLNAFAVGCPS